MAPEEIPRVAVRGQYGPGTIDGKAVARLPRGARRTRRLHHRHLRRAAPRGRELALGRRALLPAHRQAPARCATTEITIQFRRAPLILLPAAQRAAAQPAGDPRAARRAHRAALPRQVPGAAGAARAGGDDLRLQRPRRRRAAAPATRRCSTTAMIGDATSFHRADMIDAAWRVVHARPRRVGRGAARRLPELRRRHLGTAVRRGADRARRPRLARAAAVTIGR